MANLAIMRTRFVGVFGVLALCAFVVVGCGNQSKAAPLGQGRTISLGNLGTATITPFYAVHIVTYYPSSKAVPFKNATNPVQLRQGSCLGKVVAALTDGAPIPSGAPTATEASAGVYLPMAQDKSMYVDVLEKNDPNAKVLACGHPLDGGRQYFDLFLPSQGANGYGRGMVLMEPVVASRVTFSLPKAASQDMAWAIMDGKCGTQGKQLTVVQMKSGEKSSEATIYTKPSTSWALLVQPGAKMQPVCTQ